MNRVSATVKEKALAINKTSVTSVAPGDLPTITKSRTNSLSSFFAKWIDLKLYLCLFNWKPFRAIVWWPKCKKTCFFHSSAFSLIHFANLNSNS